MKEICSIADPQRAILHQQWAVYQYIWFPSRIASGFVSLRTRGKKQRFLSIVSSTRKSVLKLFTNITSQFPATFIPRLFNNYRSTSSSRIAWKSKNPIKCVPNLFCRMLWKITIAKYKSNWTLGRYIEAQNEWWNWWKGEKKNSRVVKIDLLRTEVLWYSLETTLSCFSLIKKSREVQINFDTPSFDLKLSNNETYYSRWKNIIWRHNIFSFPYLIFVNLSVVGTMT